jgi:hypothetical protein
MEKPSTQLKNEIHNVISRYGQESDVTVYETIAVLEIIKFELIEHLGSIPEDEDGN